MTRIINVLLTLRHPLDAELLQTFSPYRTEHINRSGHYVLNMDADVLPLHHELKLG